MEMFFLGCHPDRVSDVGCKDHCCQLHMGLIYLSEPAISNDEPGHGIGLRHGYIHGSLVCGIKTKNRETADTHRETLIVVEGKV
jgi:hypothetical protein